MRQEFNFLYLILAFCILIAEILIAVKFAFIGVMRGSVSDFLAVLFLYCAIRSFFAVNPFLLGLSIFLFACMIELTQYFQLSSLLGLQSNGFFGILLGGTFSWGDILMYFLGCMVASFGDRYHSIKMGTLVLKQFGSGKNAGRIGFDVVFFAEIMTFSVF